MADDFERAVLISFSYTGPIDFALKEQANVYINQLKQNPDIWKLCIERFSASAHQEVKFWCIQTLHEVLRRWYTKFNQETKSAIKGALLTWIQRDCTVEQPVLPGYLKNKVAQALVVIVQVEYPSVWPSFFHDLIGATAQGPGVVDMLCRILDSIDSDIISLDIPRSQEESRLSMAVKDAMRETSIAEVSAAWAQLLAQYHSSHPELAATILATVQKYIPWIDIGLVANHRFATLVCSLVETGQEVVRGAAMDCLTEMVSKRMEAQPKLALVQALGVVPHMKRWAEAVEGLEDDVEELRGKYTRLLATLSSEVLDSLKRVENGVISIAAMGLDVDQEATSEVAATSEAAMNLLRHLFPSVLLVFCSGAPEVAPLTNFLLAYVARLKTLSKRSTPLPGDAGTNIRCILEGIAVAGRYPEDSATLSTSNSTVDTAAAKEEQADVEEKRKDLLTLFKNVARLAFPDALAFVSSLLQSTLSNPSAPFQQVEMAVVLLYELGETAPEDSIKSVGPARNGGVTVGQLALALMQAPLPAATHPQVALAVLEAHVRYCRVLTSAPQAVPAVVATFLDQRGLGHPAEEVSVRAAYLFSRLAKMLKQNLRPHLPTIFTTLQPHLARIASTPLPNPTPAKGDSLPRASTSGPSTPVVDDRLYVFDAVGMLIGQDDVDYQQQQQLLSSLLQPLLRQIEGSLQGASAASEAARESAAAAAVQAMEAVSRLNKGFRCDLTTRLRPQLGAMFTQALQVAVAAPRAFPSHRALRARFISLLHRLVEGLMGAVLPCLPSAVEALLGAAPDAADTCEVLALLNQLLVRFKGQLQALVEALLPAVAGRVHSLLTPDWDWTGSSASPAASRAPNAASLPAPVNGVAACLEDAREQGELQRAYYSFLHALVHNNLAAALLRLPGPALQAVMGVLARGAGTHVDPAVRRTCIQVFQQLVNEWISPAGTEAVAGFKAYAMDTIGGEACILGVLQGGLDVRDAAVSTLLGDLAGVLRAVYVRCGDEFSTHLVAGALRRGGVAVNVQQQLVGRLREGDTKGVKESLQGLLPQPLGSK